MVAADATAPAVEVRGLRKVYRPSPPLLRLLARSPLRRAVVALDGVDLRVESRGLCAIVGPNGAGKTTLFRILAGLTTPTAGQASVVGLDPVASSRSVRARIGWMPSDERTLFLRMTCSENLYFHGRLQGMSRTELRASIPAVLEEVGLAEVAHHTAFALSTGMRTRLQLARALLHRPELLLLDEPTGSVDPVAAHHLLELIKDVVRRHHVAAMISSHRLEEIEALPSQLVLLDRGRVIYDGDLETLRRRWERPLVELVFHDHHSAARALALAIAAGGSFAHEGRVLRGALGDGETIGALLRRLGDVTEAITSVREVPTPLRELLARIYDSAATSAGARVRARR